MTKEYIKKSTDLSHLLPVRVRDKTLSNTIKNLFNRFLTKNESTTIFGYVGSLDPVNDVNDVYLSEPNLERTINTLIPAVYTKHATTEHVLTWNDVIQKLQLLGVNVHDIDNWGSVKPFNFVPPINLDKFCNYKEYFWLGPWVKKALENIANDWGIISPTTARIEKNILSFEVIDTDFVDASVDELWTVYILNDNNVLVEGSTVGFDSLTPFDPDHDTILSGDRVKIILKKDEYLPGDVITIRHTKLNNQFVSLFYDLLKIDNILKIKTLFKNINSDFLPDYYVMSKPNTDYYSWTDWSKTNLWVHKEDVLEFLLDNTYIDLSIDDISTSIRPIIEYDSEIQMSSKIAESGPVDAMDVVGESYTQIKKHRNQVPLFDLFLSNGKHAKKVSPIFYYAEGNNFEIDPELGRRLEINDKADFIFEHSLYDKTKNELLFYKITSGALKTIWIPGNNISPEYLKTDITGTIINVDKFQNYSNYYWVGHLLDPSVFPFYYDEMAGQPEYTCIQKTGDVSDNDWQKHNYWYHVDQLDKNKLKNYIPAIKPIIEFNARLVPSLVNPVKSLFDQKPLFKLYEFDDTIDEYVLLENGLENKFKEDIIAKNYLLIANDELPTTQKIGNKQIYEIYSHSMFKFEDKEYVQSLKNFYFNQELYEGLTYKYYGVAVGAEITAELLSPQGQQTWTLRYNVNESISAGHAVFEVIGSTTGLEAAFAHEGITYSNGQIEFYIEPAAYSISDSFTFKFNISPKFKQKNYVKLKVNLDIITGSPEDANNYVYKSVENAIDIINPEVRQNLVPANKDLKDGEFKTPQAFEFNLNNENRNKIDQGDLVFHFASIIESQPDFEGQALSSNNYRLNTPDLGLGGLIKQFNSGYNLFLGLMNQQNITPLSLIEFAKNQYLNLQNQATDYAINWVIDRIADGTLNTLSPTWEDDLFELFKSDYLLKQNTVVLESSSTVDDTLAQLFYDSTSPLPNTIITLPQLGLCSRVQPTIGLDEELGIMMLTHHDGHKSKLYNYSVDLIKKYVTKNYLRSNGQTTPGLISAKIPPSRPFKNQFWFDTATNSLYYFNVVSDTIELPEGQEIGTFSYDRYNNVLYMFDGADWVVNGALNAPWTIIPNIVDDLLLRIEQELFERIPPTSDRLDFVALESNINFDSVMEQQFNDFGTKYKIYDLYDTSYNPENPFTWNYSSVLPSATWQDNYLSLYGTTRPDLYPWLIVGEDEATFISNIGGVGNLFTATMWSYVKGIYTDPISVNTTTNTLLPPYVNPGNPASVEALMTTVPSGITDKFVFGDNGLIERVWKKSIEYNYDKVKAYFKIDPVNFVNDTWGYYNISINEHVIDRNKCRKLSQVDFALHNEKKSITDLNGEILITLNSVYSDDVYIVDVVNRLDSYYRVTRQSDGQEFFHLFDSEFSDSNILSLNVTDENYYKGLSQGDKWIVTLIQDEDPTVTFVANPNYSFTGFNQIYVQQLRQLSTSLDTAVNVSLLREYDVKMGYRVSGFLDNSLTTIKSDTFNLDNTDWSTLIKENKFLQDVWVHALRVQVVQKGSTSIRDNKQIPATAPGEPSYLAGKDWIFRVETFNKNKARLDFYEYNLNGEYENFEALNGKNSLESWRRYKEIVGTRTEFAPFLVQGIQNLITFLIGYSDKLKDAGWTFYDTNDPVVDPDTGRVLDWQLDIEYLINFLFGGNITAGLGYILNPFKNSLWINTPRGQVANIIDKNIFDFEIGQSVINVIGNEIKPSNIRVFRDNEKTEVVSDEPMYGLHLTVSEYEHIILFNNYASNINLLFDPFLGQRVYRLHFIGQKQVNFLGRPSFGGRYLLQNSMQQNIESSVEGILNYYDSNKQITNAKQTDYARSLLGYEEKDYFLDIGLTDHSAFRFWQGMIPNKGSNFSINAFSNQLNYQNVSLDECWAFKLAEYGDIGQINTPEIKLYLEDISNDFAHFKFIEIDEKDYDYGFDIFEYNVGSFGGDIILSEQDDYFAYTKVHALDEKYWFTIDDLGSHQYFEAELLNEVYILPTTLDAIYTIADNTGKMVHADFFEIVTPYEAGDPPVEEKTYRELGEYDISNEDLTTPSFTRVNSSTIKIKNSELLNKLLKVKCYGRPNKAYGPMKVIDYKNNVIVRDDLILWDPLRGIHNYRAIENIDIQTTIDPARYNNALQTTENLQYEPLRPWEENKVGKIWWDKSLVDWKPYHDTKIYGGILDRIYQWGVLADYSKIKVYQWVESPVPPSEYEKYVDSQSQEVTGDFSSYRPSGKPLKKEYQRTRYWQHRTVAWKYSENVCNEKRKFITGTDERIILASVDVGTTTGYLTTGRLFSLGLSEKSCFCNAIWNEATKTSPTADVIKVFGKSTIIGKPGFIVGSAYVMNDGGIFASSSYFSDIKIVVDSSTLTNYLTDVDGQIILDKEYDAEEGFYYLKATLVKNNRSQRILITDTPVRENTTFNYKFDDLGFTLYATTIQAHGGTGYLTSQDRINKVANDLGNTNHIVYIRQSFPIKNTIPYEYYYTNTSTDEVEFVQTQELYSMIDNVELSWVAWEEPTDIDSDDIVPMNKWEPVFGDYLEIGTDLQSLTNDIKEELIAIEETPRLGSYNSYKYIWNDWTELKNQLIEGVKFYLPGDMTQDEFCETYLTVSNGQGEEIDLLSISNKTKTMSVFINKKKVDTNRWYYVPHSTLPKTVVVKFNSSVLIKDGDLIEIMVNAYKPNQEELEFDPDKNPSKDDPMKLYQFKSDYPHTRRDQYTNYGYKGTPKYYFWVTDVKSKTIGKKLSTSNITNLLTNNTDPYSIIQGLKYFNPLNEKPNRYSLLTVKNLNQIVGTSDTYKLRFTTDFSLREKNTSLDLKNVHTEWIKLRERQSAKIPRVLWDAVINSMCGENALSEQLPSYRRELYDRIHGTAYRYGFSPDQALGESGIIIDTVQYTILNTQLHKYIDSVNYIPDTINFSSFGNDSNGELYDISNLDFYLSSSSEIRKLMENIWTHATSKQINEIFFAVLNDALTYNKDMKDIFKTSIVSMQLTRVVKTDQETGQFVSVTG